MSRLRHSIVGSALLLATLPAPRLANAAGTLLRYHFVDGQTLTYRGAVTTASAASVGGKALPTPSDTMTYLVHYGFSHITEGGGAALTMRTDHIVDRLTQGGKTMGATPPASTAQFQQQLDGSQYGPDGVHHGAYGNGDLGQLTMGSVAVGDHWMTSLTDRTAIFGPNAVMTCRNTLAGFARAPVRAADIQTACSIAGHAAPTVGGRRYRFMASDSLSGRWRFDVANGRFLAEALRDTVTETGTVSDARGVHPFSQRTTQTYTQQLVSVQG